MTSLLLGFVQEPKRAPPPTPSPSSPGPPSLLPPPAPTPHTCPPPLPGAPGEPWTPGKRRYLSDRSASLSSRRLTKRSKVRCWIFRRRVANGEALLLLLPFFLFLIFFRGMQSQQRPLDVPEHHTAAEVSGGIAIMICAFVSSCLFGVWRKQEVGASLAFSLYQPLSFVPLCVLHCNTVVLSSTGVVLLSDSTAAWCPLTIAWVTVE